jgi:hypothetical protein
MIKKYLIPYRVSGTAGSQQQLMGQWNYEYEIMYEEKLGTFLQIVSEALVVCHKLQT